MHHARDDVFSRAAFALNEYRNVGAGDFFQALADLTHGVRAAKNNSIGRHVTDTLYQRTARICHCCAHIFEPAHPVEHLMRQSLHTLVQYLDFKVTCLFLDC